MVNQKLHWMAVTPVSGDVVTPEGKLLATYYWGQDSRQPYLHPVCSYGADHPLTLYAPFDHSWHKGLWWSWKLINGVIFWEDRVRDGAGVTGLPETLDDYIDFSMIAQAEGLKFGIEHFRRRKPHCSGTLFWQLNDCWPVLSWSVIDYYGVGKAGYYYIKRVYAPVLASFKQLDNGSVTLWLTNDTLQPVNDSAIVQLRTFSGEVLREERHPVQVDANDSAAVACLDDIPTDPSTYLSVRAENSTFADNRLFFVPFKDLERAPVAPQINVQQVGSTMFEITFSADAFAYFVHITTSEQGAMFSDNYFDVEPGRPRTVTVEGVSSADALQFGWR